MDKKSSFLLKKSVDVFYASIANRLAGRISKFYKNCLEINRFFYEKQSKIRQKMKIFKEKHPEKPVSEPKKIDRLFLFAIFTKKEIYIL